MVSVLLSNTRLNIRHENMAVTMGPYLPLPKQRKEDLIKSLKPAYWR